MCGPPAITISNQNQRIREFVPYNNNNNNNNNNNIYIYIYLYIYIYIYICISSRIFENIPQNGPEFSYRNLALARFLVTVARKNIGGLLSWLVSLSSSVTIANSPWVGNGPPLRGGCCKSLILSVSLVLGESVHWSCLPLVCHVKFL